MMFIFVLSRTCHHHSQKLEALSGAFGALTSSHPYVLAPCWLCFLHLQLVNDALNFSGPLLLKFLVEWLSIRQAPLAPQQQQVSDGDQGRMTMSDDLSPAAEAPSAPRLQVREMQAALVP